MKLRLRGQKTFVMDDVDAEQDGEMEDSVPKEADDGAGVGDIVFDEQEAECQLREL